MRLKYQRFSEKDKLLIKKLTEKGESLKKVSELFNTGKSAIYYQTRKFRPRIKKEFISNLNEFKIGELIGAFAGDGDYFHRKYDKNNSSKSSDYRITYYLTFSKEKEYALYLISMLKSLNLNPHLYSNKSVFIIVVKSKEYAEFIKNYIIWDKNKTLSIRLKKRITEFSEEFLEGFARGLMDTDGFVESSNVSCACASEKLIDNLEQILSYFNIKYKRSIKFRAAPRSSLHLIRVYADSLERYHNLIGFSNNHKINSLNKILSNKYHRKS